MPRSGFLVLLFFAFCLGGRVSAAEDAVTACSHIKSQENHVLDEVGRAIEARDKKYWCNLKKRRIENLEKMISLGGCGLVVFKLKQYIKTDQNALELDCATSTK